MLDMRMYMWYSSVLLLSVPLYICAKALLYKVWQFYSSFCLVVIKHLDKFEKNTYNTNTLEKDKYENI